MASLEALSAKLAAAADPEGMKETLLATELAGIITALQALPRSASSAGGAAACALLDSLVSGSETRARAVIDRGGVAAMITAMRAHPLDADLANEVANTLARISRGSDPLKEGVMAADGIAALSQILRAHAASTDVAAACCDALDGVINWSDGNAKLLASRTLIAAGGITVVVGAVREHPSHERVAAFGSRVLERMAIAGGNSSVRAMLTAGAVPAVETALRLHVRTAFAVPWCCSCLVNLTLRSQFMVGEGGATGAVSSRGVVAVIAALRLHAGVGYVAEDALGLIAGFAQVPPQPGSPSPQEFLASVGAPAAITAILKAFLHNGDTLTTCCLALTKIVHGSTVGSQAVVTAGAYPAVVAAMRAHPSNARLVAWGTSVIACCTLVEVEAAVEAGCIGVLVAALLAYPSDEVVVASCAGALANIAVTHKGAVAAGGAAAVLVTAIRMHSHQKQVVSWACSALDHMTSPTGDWDPRCAADVVDAGGPLAVVAALRLHCGSPDITTCCLGVLGNLCTFGASEAHSRAIVAAGGAAAIASTMRARPDDLHIIRLSCSVLTFLTRAGCTDATKLAVVKAGCVAHMVHALHTHSSEAEIAYWVLETLLQLATPAATLAASVTEKFLPAIVATLRAHPTDPKLAATACALLGNVAPLPVVAPHLSGSAVKAVIAVLRRHASDLKVATLAMNALLSFVEAAQDCAPAVLAADGVAALLAGLRAHPDGLTIASQGLQLLLRASDDVAMRGRAVFTDGVAAAALAALRAFTGDTIIARSGCSVLVRFMAATAVPRPLAANAVAVVAIVARVHAGDGDTVQLCCSLLRLIAASSEARTQRAFVDQGGALALCDAMRAHPTNASIAESACAALACIAASGPAGGLGLLAAGGAAALVAALRAHVAGGSSSSKAVVSSCVQALAGLASDSEEQRAAVVSAGGVAALVATMQALSKDSAMLAGQGCAALACIAAGSYEQQQAVISAGGPSAVVAALAAHASNDAVALSGCNALARMAPRSHEQKQAVDAVGGAAAVIAVTCADATTGGEVSRADVAALASSITPESEAGPATLIMEADGVAAVAEAMHAHPRSAQVALAGCAALGGLLASHGGASPKAVSLSVTAIAAALRAHRNDADIALAGCKALGSVAAGPDAHVQALVAARGVDAVVSAMHLLHTQEAVQEAGRTALRAVARHPAGHGAIEAATRSGDVGT